MSFSLGWILRPDYHLDLGIRINLRNARKIHQVATIPTLKGKEVARMICPAASAVIDHWRMTDIGRKRSVDGLFVALQ